MPGLTEVPDVWTATPVDGSAPVPGATAAVFASVALGMLAVHAGFTAAPLAAMAITVTPRWGGLPGAAGTLGYALGATLLTAITARRGRRFGLVAGWGLGVTGAGLAVAGTATGSLPLLAVGMAAIGCGHGANQLARYAAADVYPRGRRASVISLTVWAGSLGAVTGPGLLAPAGAFAETAGLPSVAGGFLVGAATFAAAAVVCHLLLRPDPEHRPATVRVSRLDSSGLERSGLLAVGALLTAQATMVLIMTATVMHLGMGGHADGRLGGTMTVHLLGMFALAPVIGRLSDRCGAPRVTLVGLLGVTVAGAVAAAAHASIGVLTVALFALGLGWCAAFVASSAMLTGAGTRLQGRVEAVLAVASGVSTVLAGLLLAGYGYAAVCSIGAATALVVSVIIVGTRGVPALATA